MPEIVIPVDPTDLVRQVPAWALWLEIVLGTIALAAVVDQVRDQRSPVLLALLAAACVAYGVGGLVLG